jgi:hypothetical protein
VATTSSMVSLNLTHLPQLADLIQEGRKSCQFV